LAAADLKQLEVSLIKLRTYEPFSTKLDQTQNRAIKLNISDLYFWERLKQEKYRNIRNC
jgi:hypothetical protein